jgi:CRISPR-associated protein Csb1
MSKRQLLDVRLKPVIGSRFQPTGFPDIGNALFERPVPGGGWEKALLVESAQSMANRLEGMAWDAGADGPDPTFDGLPYVRVTRDGTYITSSRTEAHRLASAFVKDSSLSGNDMKGEIRERLKLSDDRPLSSRDIAAAVFALDPFCLIHGVFFAESAKVWPGQPKIARAVTGMVEAHDVKRAESGGVKRDDVRHSIGEGAGGSAEGYGSIPFHRTEWTAQTIVAMFAIDLAQIESYGLPAPAGALLTAIARWEIASLLDAGLRLRTACDLEVVDPDSVDLARPDDLATEIRSLIGQCGGMLGDGAPIVVEWNGGKKVKAS